MNKEIPNPPTIHLHPWIFWIRIKPMFFMLTTNTCAHVYDAREWLIIWNIIYPE